MTTSSSDWRAAASVAVSGSGTGRAHSCARGGREPDGPSGARGGSAASCEPAAAEVCLDQPGDQRQAQPGLVFERRAVTARAGDLTDQGDTPGQHRVRPRPVEQRVGTVAPGVPPAQGAVREQAVVRARDPDREVYVPGAEPAAARETPAPPGRSGWSTSFACAA